MADQTLPAEVQELLKYAIDSVDHLEVLLLLLRAPSHVYHIEEIASILRIQPDVAAAAAAMLHQRRLLARDERTPAAYYYAPATLTLHAAVEGTALAWQTNPVGVMKAIYDKSSSALRTFADAFRLRRHDLP